MCTICPSKYTECGRATKMEGSSVEKRTATSKRRVVRMESGYTPFAAGEPAAIEWLDGLVVGKDGMGRAE